MMKFLVKKNPKIIVPGNIFVLKVKEKKKNWPWPKKKIKDKNFGKKKRKKGRRGSSQFKKAKQSGKKEGIKQKGQFWYSFGQFSVFFYKFTEKRENKIDAGDYNIP